MTTLHTALTWCSYTAPTSGTPSAPLRTVSRLDGPRPSTPKPPRPRGAIPSSCEIHSLPTLNTLPSCHPCRAVPYCCCAVPYDVFTFPEYAYDQAPEAIRKRAQDELYPSGECVQVRKEGCPGNGKRNGTTLCCCYSGGRPLGCQHGGHLGSGACLVVGISCYYNPGGVDT